MYGILGLKHVFSTFQETVLSHLKAIHSLTFNEIRDKIQLIEA